MANEQLQQAHHLIEQGRISEARALLRTLDDPTARLWLRQLSANKRPGRQESLLSLPLLVALAIVIGVIALILILLLTPTLLNRMQNRAEDAANGELQVYNALATYCMAAVGAVDESPCTSWTEAVIATYRAVADACVDRYDAQTLENTVALGMCLEANGVPPPL